MTLRHSWDLTFVDPKGDVLLPPHYDYAKMAKVLPAGYDCVQYGRYELRVQAEGGTVRIDVAVDDEFSGHYGGHVDQVVRALPEYAAAERPTEDEFWRATVAAEWADVVPFAWYQAHHGRGRDANRACAYLGIGAMMAREIMTRGPEDVPPRVALV